MAYPIWQATITDDSGNVLPGAEITVVNEETGLNAPLYSTRNGTSKSNPFFAGVDGFAQFHAAPGLYRITATDGGTGTTQTFRYVRLVELATTAEALAGTAGVLPDAAGVNASIENYLSDLKQVLPFVKLEDFGYVSGPANTALSLAVASGNPVLLTQMFPLSENYNIPDGAMIFGAHRSTTGFIADPLFSIPGAASSVLSVDAASNGVALFNFRIDANNVGDGVTKRLNALSLSGGSENSNIRAVDVYNTTGYGHVTFGSESSPNVTAYYDDCYADNCQVPFEQIGALDVTLIHCRARGVAGRTFELFHPYAGSKKVTYISCHGFGEAGAGVNIVTTNSHPVGPITFENCSIDITGTTSAVNVALSSGSPADVDVTFSGGRYKTSGGASAALGSIGEYKIRGAVFDGPQGFNCPATADAHIDFTDAKIVASGSSPSGIVFGLITNGATVKLVGGSVTATNADVGGAQAILGSAERVSNETTLTPRPASGVSTKAFTAGEVSLQADGANSFANIYLPENESDTSKIAVTLSLLSPTDTYLAAHSITWNNIDSTQIRVRVLGLNSTSNKLSYSIRILE